MPLTEAERVLDPKSIIANQPDFVADEVFFYGEGFGGFSAKSQVARKGSRYRIDTGVVVVITEPGKPSIRLYAGSKTFEETIANQGPPLGSGQPINPQALAYREGVIFTSLGTQVVDGHKCLKIEAKSSGQSAKIYLYAAEDLNYLVIAAQVLNPPRGAIQRLQNISLKVPDSLFEIPSGYKRLPKYRWERVDAAKVTYDGKPHNDFSVYRSHNGDLFVTLTEPHPATGVLLHWHYLVWLKEKIVEVAYQGTLITSKGEFAWQSEEKEAFSTGDSTPDRGSPPCSERGCPKTVVGTNYVQFPSVYYEDRKSMIRVAW